MKWVLREDDISVLIEFGKKNLSSGNYLFVTTKDMLEQTEMNLDTFCTKIQPKTIISGFEERIDKKLEKEIDMPKLRISKRALVIFSIKKELIDKETLENFTDVDEKLLPIIQVVNSFDNENPHVGKRDLEWLIDKIHGKEIEFTDHIPTRFEFVGTTDVGNMEQHYGYVNFEPPFEDFRPVTIELTTLVVELEKKFGFSPELSQMQILILKLATKIDAENYQAVEQLGLTYAKKQNWKQAKELLIKSLEINPKFSAARIMLAEAYTNLYQFSMALYEIEKIDLTNMPDIVKLNIFLIKAKIKMIRGDLDGADLEFQNAHKIGEKTNDDWKHLEMGLYSGWAICQIEKGDYERVIEILEMGKQKRPNNLPFWNSIGCQYSLLGEHDKSLDAWEHAYKIDSREPNVLINLGLLYLRKNDDQTALKYYQKAKTSLEEGYEKFTEYEDGIPITKILLTLTNNAIRVITEGSNEDKEQLIIETGGKIQTKEEFYPLPDPPKKRKLEEYEEINIRCKRTIQNFIRKKYHADPEKFRKDFPSNYDEAKERFEEDDKKMNPQKDADLFTFIDTGVFPFIIRKKTDDWGLAMDCFNLVSMLYTNRDARNDQAHEMETTTRQKEIKFLNQLELIDFFEIKIMQ